MVVSWTLPIGSRQLTQKVDPGETEKAPYQIRAHTVLNLYRLSLVATPK